MGANLVGLKLALSFVDLRSQILGVYVATSPGFYLGFYFGWYRVLGITSSGGSTVGYKDRVSPDLWRIIIKLEQIIINTELVYSRLRGII